MKNLKSIRNECLCADCRDFSYLKTSSTLTKTEAKTMDDDEFYALRTAFYVGDYNKVEKEYKNLS